MQPYFFPYIGYFQAINAVDKYILYDNLNFIKEAWMNRNKYLIKNGTACYFHAPIKEKSSYKKIHEIELIENDKWKKKILHSLFFNYKKAKYFDDVYSLVSDVINYQTNKLSRITLHILLDDLADSNLAKELLFSVAAQNKQIKHSGSEAPQVLFNYHGADLSVVIINIENKNVIISELISEIEKTFIDQQVKMTFGNQD